MALLGKSQPVSCLVRVTHTVFVGHPHCNIILCELSLSEKVLCGNNYKCLVCLGPIVILCRTIAYN